MSCFKMICHNGTHKIIIYRDHRWRCSNDTRGIHGPFAATGEYNYSEIYDRMALLTPSRHYYHHHEISPYRWYKCEEVSRLLRDKTGSLDAGIIFTICIDSSTTDARSNSVLLSSVGCMSTSIRKSKRNTAVRPLGNGSPGPRESVKRNISLSKVFRIQIRRGKSLQV